MKREAVFKGCMDLLNSKINEVSKRLEELKYALTSEEKSTAGDKHETSRAMINLEQEKTSSELEELLLKMNQLRQLQSVNQGQSIVHGSLFQSGKQLIFLAVALGKIVIEGEEVIVISPASPLGKLLSGKSIGDKVILNGNTFSVDGFL